MPDAMSAQKRIETVCDGRAQDLTFVLFAIFLGPQPVGQSTQSQPLVPALESPSESENPSPSLRPSPRSSPSPIPIPIPCPSHGRSPSSSPSPIRDPVLDPVGQLAVSVPVPFPFPSTSRGQALRVTTEACATNGREARTSL